MDWITDHIAIGNYLDAQDAAQLQRAGIASILSLDGSLAGRDPAELGVRQIAVVKLIDGPGNDRITFFRAVDTLARLLVAAPPSSCNVTPAAAARPSWSRVTSCGRKISCRPKPCAWSAPSAPCNSPVASTPCCGT